MNTSPSQLALNSPLRAVGAFGLAILLSACAHLEDSGHAVPPHGGKVTYSLAGQGTPAVVLQSGLGDGRAPWATVYQALLPRHRVLALDRPGYGASPAASGPRDPCQIATETRQVLQQAGVSPPYLLVGHSLGGLYQYVFARLYPQDVAGLVLLDPTHPTHWATVQSAAPASASLLRAMRATVFSSTMRAEFDEQASCLDRLDTLPPLQAPTTLLWSTVASEVEGREFRRALGELRKDWASLTHARNIINVAGSGHYIQRDAPRTVVDAIDTAVKLSR